MSGEKQWIKQTQSNMDQSAASREKTATEIYSTAPIM
jgi:hypothetical protein